ncbi:hypothetical protein CEXT_297311 [Caerostris extrusa]|uniref:Uncharacterized protein n=1 Tax=Caerostris extrusa TaxID=172846 RepID=A0AAV4MEK4_CAEEX|nr:hypothetical protein CEXT_297311 [Caerostris extrusa]
MLVLAFYCSHVSADSLREHPALLESAVPGQILKLSLTASPTATENNGAGPIRFGGKLPESFSREFCRGNCLIPKALRALPQRASPRLRWSCSRVTPRRRSDLRLQWIIKNQLFINLLSLLTRFTQHTQGLLYQSSMHESPSATLLRFPSSVPDFASCPLFTQLRILALFKE